MSSSVGWECQKCTYYHKAPGTRCVMCDSLRVTREQMRDFVLGKTLPKNNAEGVKENHPPTSRFTSAAPVQTIRNPYASSKTVAPARPQNAIQSTLSMSQGGSSGTGNTANNVNAAASFSRQQQRQTQSTAWQPHSDLAERSTIGTSGIGISSLPRPEIASAVRHNGPAHSKPTPRPPSAGNLNATQWAPVSSSKGINMNGSIENVASRMAPQPARPNSAHLGQTKKNPFTMAVRPPPMAYTPGPVPLCPETASDWVYPIHQAYPVRDYQLEISKTAVLCNTLVSLPTGLGKTLIASVVLYNFYRWFPTGKVIFLAPTLPLVNQQVKACYDIMGIPATDTALLTGKVAAKERQVLWNERRVFFCTPQTVQRDIDSGGCPAQRVVCVVFDEAHKASGSYAYTQVVEQLETAGARYRILGLSATPGTGIKQIQEVVTALRIQKIEARLEDDPSVKKYVHERHSEIITVQQGSAITNIERMLNDLIAPLLERLRSGNGLAMIRGNATLTPWCIIRAREEYHTRTQDHSLDSYFYAAHSLIMIRSEIRKTGIGMVRSKIIQLKNEPKGIMMSIVKGKEFQAVWEAILRASSDPNSVNEPAEDRKLNNPKLLKLDEILTEHFERARACGKSSRAIVFSQWRDSVSEIVAVLSSNQPLLRPRHFVGQGKSTGGANKQNVDQSCVSLKGMKQKEQQRAIKEFREGKFNILVCTCIGEEGLDIGEVDLIVNYDSLRSPIRMIQRVGRTGRKRDGRVVCLVSEGQEQRTMMSSKAAEKTLGRALKRPDSFTVIKSTPMFPQEPIMRQVDMSVSSQFHLSQVGGNGVASRSRRDSCNVAKTRTESEIMMNWRLTDAQERHREAILGDIPSSACLELHTSDGKFPQALRRRFLRARTRSISSYRNRTKSSTVALGVSRAILTNLECVHASDFGSQVLVNRSLSTTRRSRRESGLLQLLFPLERSNETNNLERDLLKMSLSARSIERSDPLQDKNRIEKEPVSSQHKNGSSWNSQQPASSLHVPKTAHATQPENPYRPRSIERPILSESLICEQEVAHMYVNDLVTTHEAYEGSAQGLHVEEPPIEATEFRLPTQSESSSSDASDSDDNSDEEKGISDGCKPHGFTPEALPCELKAYGNDERVRIHEVCHNAMPERESEYLHVEDAPLPDPSNDTLQLPTQESSSDDESRDRGSESDQSSHTSPSKVACHPPAVIHFDQSAVQDQGEMHDASQEDCESDKLRALESDGRKGFPLPTISNAPEGKKVDSPRALMDIPDDHGRQSLSIDRVSHYVATPLAVPRSSNFSGADMSDTPQYPTSDIENGPGTKTSSKAASRKGFDLWQLSSTTQEKKADPSQDLIDTPAATPLAASRSFDFSDGDLADTPLCHDSDRMLPPPERTTMVSNRSEYVAPDDDVDDVVCAVCFDGFSPDDNPIVLCDGPNNDLSCPIAVHKLCYSISVPLEDTEIWYCDVCEIRLKQPSVSSIQCAICQKEDGPLKHLSHSTGKSWFHPYCQHAVFDQGAGCQYCSAEGGTCCAFDGCTEYAHPHCGLTKSKKPWIVLAYKSTESSNVGGCRIYCPYHRDQVRRALLEDAVDLNTTSKSLRYVVFSNELEYLSVGTAPTEAVQRKRLRKKSEVVATEAYNEAVASSKNADGCIEADESREQKRRRIVQRMQERTNGMNRCRFLQLEADIDSDEDVDGDYGEYDEVRRIEEEEEFNDSFINDSSQLDYTQDELDRLGLSENAQTPRESGAIHRAVDIAKERMNQFATPIFNRRMVKHGRKHANATPGSGSHDWDQPTPQSAPSSEKGLGNMHFIRSVLEHHRNGGDAEDIEEAYERIAQETSPSDDERSLPESTPAGPIVMRYVASDSESSESDEEEHQGKLRTVGDEGISRPSHSEPKPGGLRAEQRAMIEAKRQEALRRRQQLQSQSTTR